MTTRLLVLTTFAVDLIAMVTGRRPQRNLMTPPLATARTTARDVQLRAVPCPTMRVARALTARPAAGTATRGAVPAAPAGTGRASARSGRPTRAASRAARSG